MGWGRGGGGGGDANALYLLMLVFSFVFILTVDVRSSDFMHRKLEIKTKIERLVRSCGWYPPICIICGRYLSLGKWRWAELRFLMLDQFVPI